ncbi:MAG: cyclic nucleotide-binding/CBS domain-containing protein [Nitrospinota bacterium]
MSEFKTLLAVGDIMNKEIVSIAESETVQIAAARMAAENISSLLLVNGKDEPSGIVTEQDIVRRAVATGMDITINPISMVMSKEIVRIAADESVFEARNLMKEKNLNHLVVVKNEKPVGILTTSHLLGG